MDNIPTPFRFLAPRYLHVHICIVHGNAISHFATPAISQFHNVSMPQCVNAAHSRCVNACMSQCFVVNASMCKRLMLAMLQLLIGSSGRFLPPDSPLLNVSLAQCCWRLAPSPMYPPAPSTQYLVIYIYISYILSTASIPLLLVSCPMSLAPCVTHFMFLVFPVPGSYVACLMSFVYPVPRLLFPLTGFVSLVLCPMSPGRPLPPAIKQASSQYQKLANSQVSKPWIAERRIYNPRNVFNALPHYTSSVESFNIYQVRLACYMFPPLAVYGTAHGTIFFENPRASRTPIFLY